MTLDPYRGGSFQSTKGGGSSPQNTVPSTQIYFTSHMSPTAIGKIPPKAIAAAFTDHSTVQVPL